MFASDAWLRWNKSEASWIITLRSVIAFILLAVICVSIVVLSTNVADNATFFQIKEDQPDARGIPVPDIHICYMGNYALNSSILTGATPPNGTINLSCAVQTYSTINKPNMTDCSGWLHPIPILLPFESFYKTCYQLRAPTSVGYSWLSGPPNTGENPMEGLTLIASIPDDFAVSMSERLYINLVDYDYDPYLQLYGIAPPDYTVIDGIDLNQFQWGGSFSSVPRFRSAIQCHFDTLTSTYFHRFITNRNLVDRGLWEAFSNYLGLWKVTSQIQTVDVWAADVSPVTMTTSYRPVFWTATDMNTETVQTEIRVHTVISSLSSLGGLYSLIAGIYILLFGGKPEQRWGIVHKWAIGPSKKIIQTKLRDAFKTSTGMPLADRTNWRNVKKPVDELYLRALGERLQALEDILGEYFVDPDFLKQTENHVDDDNSSTTRNEYEMEEEVGILNASTY